MDDIGILQDCVAAMEAKAWKASFLPIGRLDDIRKDLWDFRDNAIIDVPHFEYLMNCFNFEAAASFPKVASLLIIACPSSLRTIAFQTENGLFEATIPPVYAERAIFEESVVALLKPILASGQRGIASTDLPEKLMAAHAGLARIGMNRIAYVDGIGSFLRLAAFVTDLPIAEDPWQQVERPRQCEVCGACVRACPSGAISPNKAPLAYRKCLTHWNEEIEGEFPDWLESSWHNAAIGCMRCQAACPLNAQALKTRVAGPRFDLSESSMILSGATEESLPPTLREKLYDCGLLRYLSFLARNLSALGLRREETL